MGATEMALFLCVGWKRAFLLVDGSGRDFIR